MIYQTPSNIVAGTSSRYNGHSKKAYYANNLALNVGDRKEDVMLNRHQLAQSIHTALDQWIFVKQNHTTNIKHVTNHDASKGAYDFNDGILNADGLYTFDRNVVLAFAHADCVPILMYDETQHFIAAIHAGTQGTLNGIVDASLTQLLEKYPQLQASKLKVIIGPCLAFKSSRLSFDITTYKKTAPAHYLPHIYSRDDGFIQVDTRKINENSCLAHGILAANIFHQNDDTYSNLDYFSYQRDPICGRHLSFIMQK